MIIKNTINLSLSIPANQIDEYNRMMSVDELDYEEHDIPRYSTINSWTVNAGNGYEIDVKVCSSIDGNPLWCEAVLFLDGCELACSDVESELDGEWQLETNGVNFVLNVSKC